MNESNDRRMYPVMALFRASHTHKARRRVGKPTIRDVGQVQSRMLTMGGPGVDDVIAADP